MAGIVADASVLISLAAAGQFGLLQELYGEITLPDAVWQEVTLAGTARPGAKEAAAAQRHGWLKIKTPQNKALIRMLCSSLGSGEAEAIALASEVAADLLLIDEADGRRKAVALGLKVTGTVGVLIRAKETRKLLALKPVLDRLIQQHNFRLNRLLYEQALKDVGETP